MLFFTPAIKAVSSTMQLNILRFGGSGARMVASGFAARGGKVLRRIVDSARCERERGCVVSAQQGVAGALWERWFVSEGSVRDV